MKKRSHVVRFEAPAEPELKAVTKKIVEKEEEVLPHEDHEELVAESSYDDDDGSSADDELDDEVPEQGGLDFAGAFQSILNEPLRNEPVLAKNMGFAGELKKRKMEVSVEKKVAEARKMIREQWKKKPDPHEAIEVERVLKKVATSGVVKLFNAINNQQKQQQQTDVPASDKAARALQSLTRESFLGALKNAPTNSKKKKQNVRKQNMFSCFLFLFFRLLRQRERRGCKTILILTMRRRITDAQKPWIFPMMTNKSE
jgi:hypothetical protein